MDSSLLFETPVERKTKKSLSERVNMHGLLHFNIAQTAIFGAYIWMRGSNGAFSIEAFAIATTVIVTGWLVQGVLMFSRPSTK